MEPLNTTVYDMHWKENNDLLRKCLINSVNQTLSLYSS